MGQKAYTRHLRVAGNVQPGSIDHHGAGANFVLVENSKRLPVDYDGEEPPPDTFKDNAQALAIGMYGRDGVFHATELQAKCASKYAPKPETKPQATASRASSKLLGLVACPTFTLTSFSTSCATNCFPPCTRRRSGRSAPVRRWT